MIHEPIAAIDTPFTALSSATVVHDRARLDPRVLPKLGGKARGLAVLEQMGQPVTPWYALSVDAFRGALAASGLAERIAARLGRVDVLSTEALRAAAEEIRGWVLSLELPPSLEREISQTHQNLGFNDDPVAVRSSAVDEDGAGGSFAGLHDSILPVRGLRAVLAAVRGVWASAWSERALAYRLARKLPLVEIEMAVVIQRMVLARTSGVLFTAHPVTGNVHQIVISALYGLGEGLVGLGLEADRYTVDKGNLSIQAELADKREQAVPGDIPGEVARTPVAADLRHAGSLDREEVLVLARAGLAIERRFGRPQDIEFAFDVQGRLFILQARPIVTIEEYGPAAGQRIFWDHQNWAENYPGLTLPMTYSVTRRMERVTYRSFAEMMRIPRDVIDTYQTEHETSLGYIRGRIFTHGQNRYRLLRQIPGIGFRRSALLALLGVRPQEVDREIPDVEPGPFRRWLVEFPALLRLIAGLGTDFLRVHRMVEDLLESARQFQRRCAALDFRALQPHELIAIYSEVETRLVSRWKAPLINVLCLRFSWVVLKKLCAAWCGDTAGSLPQQLLRGEEGSESGRPVRMLLDLAHAASRQPELREMFRREMPEDLARKIPSDPRFADFAAAVERYLELFYFKGLHEMKMEDVTFRDRPDLLYRMIQGYLEQDDPAALDPQAWQERERRARREAEERAFSALGRGLRSFVFRRLLANVRSLDHHREEFKFMRLQLMGLLRELLRALGERFAAEEILDHPRDVFYLTLEEILDYARGTSVTADLRGLVALRRREIASWQDGAPDDQFETYGLVYHRNRHKARREAEQGVVDGQLRGTGCCPGKVTGTVRVLRSPADAARLAGEILAVERIHTGWLPLLPTVSGLLVERGEILSHSATVAREMGIPTIVGIPGLLGSVRDGQRITMDGSLGTVILVPEAPAPGVQPEEG